MPSPSRRQPYLPPPPTHAPAASSSSLRKRKSPSTPNSVSDSLGPRSHRPFTLRDEIADEAEVNEAANRCQVFSSNAVISCFPLSNTSIPQHQIASFVWNSRLPQITQTNLVNIYLLDAVSTNVIHKWENEPNPYGRAGIVRFPVNDTWFGPRGAHWNGQPTPYLFYWVITRSDATLDSGIPQPVFAAVQTTFADSVVASMASTASVASASAASVSSAIAASLSSLSAASLTSAHSSPSSTSGPGNGNVQNDGSGSSFPRWAIAVIVVLGALALLATGILAFFIMRRMRNRRGASLSHRGSMGSSTPMMANAPQSPLLGSVGLVSAGMGSHRPHSPDVHDGASTMSRGSDPAPFSGADAAVMATAFRDMLRKPNFSDRPDEEGDSPDDHHVAPDMLLNRELAEEGRDIRSVSSSRGVKVETLNGDDDADTVQDHHHH
ncbi:hypothetical protein BXZ70DRAFT_597226 [Cristinia sonorae]|uniref:Mid2 domain-containing protein n=1 Tax=Cristinia sonorae TaxID=1940300 RepID=A0A8K0UUK1_9AGAR|nr:hypothetical protein BXZ70DRAFT_597226 [Cristinia sonorae]